MVAPVQAGPTKTVYVANAPEGDDANSGTISDPWETIDKINTLFAQNPSYFNPGDTILFKSGDTWNEQLDVTSSGSTGGVITIGAYGSGEPPIIGYTGTYPNDGTGWAVTDASLYPNVYERTTSDPNMISQYLEPGVAEEAGYGRAFRIFLTPDYHVDICPTCCLGPSGEECLPDVSATPGSLWFSGSKVYVHAFDDLVLTGNTTPVLYYNDRGTPHSNAGVDVTDQSYITIQDLHLMTGISGIYCEPCDEILVKDCRISGNQSATIFIENDVPEFSHDIECKDNDVRYNGNGFKFRKAYNINIHGNTIAHARFGGRRDTDHEATGFNSCHDLEVHDNDMYEIGIGASVYVGPGKVLDDFKIHHNYMHEYIGKGVQFAGPGEYKGAMYVYHNVIWASNMTGQGVALDALSDDVDDPNPRPIFYVWNNTIHAHEGLRIGLTGIRIDYSVANNLLVGCTRFIRDTDEAQNGSTGHRVNNYYFPALNTNNVIWFEGEDPPGVVYNGESGKTFSDYQIAVAAWDDDENENEDSSICNGVDPERNETGLFPFRLKTTSDCVDAGIGTQSGIPYDSCTDLDFYGVQAPSALGDEITVYTPSMGAGESTVEDSCPG